VRSLKDLPVTAVRLLGSTEPVVWDQTPAGLRVTLPRQISSPYGYALEVKTR